MRFSIAALIVLVVAQVATAAAASYTAHKSIHGVFVSSDNSDYIDLRYVMKEGGYSSVADGYTYQFGFVNVPSKNDCGSDVIVCQHQSKEDSPDNTRANYYCGAVGTRAIAVAGESNEDSVVSLTYTAEQARTDGSIAKRTSIFTIKCDETAKDYPTPKFSDADLTYSTTISSISGCKQSYGLSTGSIMLLIIFIGGGLLAACAFGYNYKVKGLAVKEAIPGREAVPAFFGLAKEGIMFLVGKCTGKSGGSYEQVA